MGMWPESEAADLEFEFEVSTYGTCFGPEDPVFNPLEEKDAEGNPVMFQDPSRGTLAGFTSNEDGAANNEIGNWPIQFDFMQNLSGENSIVGRSIYVFAIIEETPTVIDCCSIVVDKPPMGYVNPSMPTY